jgi:hypothetical protein
MIMSLLRWIFDHPLSWMLQHAFATYMGICLLLLILLLIMMPAGMFSYNYDPNYKSPYDDDKY